MKTLTLPNGGSHAAEFRRGSIFFAATSAVIIRYGGFTILTDPEDLPRDEQLPPVDLVVLSHMPGDAMTRFDRRTPIVATREAAATLERRGFERTLALETWEPLQASKGDSLLRVTAMPARRAPALLRIMIPPVMGCMLEFSSGQKVPLRMYLTGKSVVDDQLKEIPRRYLNIDVALMQLDPERAAEAVRIVRPHTAIPIHHDGNGGSADPHESFRRAMRDAGVDNRVRYVARGETFEIEVPDVRL